TLVQRGDTNTVYDHHGRYLLNVSKNVKKLDARTVAKRYPNLKTLHIWAVASTEESVQFIIELCRMIGQGLTTLNLWLEEQNPSKSILAELFHVLNTRLPDLRNLTLYIDQRYKECPLEQVDLPILGRLEKCILRLQLSARQIMPTIRQYAQH